MKMLKEAYEEAKEMLKANRPIMDKIASFLIEKETITGKEFMEIFHQCKREMEDKQQDVICEEVVKENETEELETTEEVETVEEHKE